MRQPNKRGRVRRVRHDGPSEDVFGIEGWMVGASQGDKR